MIVQRQTLEEQPPLKPSPLTMEILTDPAEIEKARDQDRRFQRNLDWYQARIVEIGDKYRGKCICVAGEELFVADTPEEVVRLARTAHPEDDGRFLHYVSRHKGSRIYENRPQMAGG